MKQLTIEIPYHVDQVHVYLAEINNDLVLFDTGPPLESAKRVLRDNIDFERLRYVFVTHDHIDHYGLAGFLKHETGAQIVLPRKAIQQLAGGKNYSRMLIDVFSQLGFPRERTSKLIEAVDKFGKLAPMPTDCLAAEDSVELLAELGIDFLSCPWHSQCDLVYLHKNYAVVGDVALRGIFPVPLLAVDLACPHKGRFDNYNAFCTSIDRLKQLQGKVLLPAHNHYLKDLDAWVCFVVSKVVDRAAKLLEYYRAGESVYQTVEALFGKPVSDHLNVYLKTSEVAFMFDFLRTPEKLRQVMLKHDLYDRVAINFNNLSH